MKSDKVKPNIYLAGKVRGPKWELIKGCEDRANFLASDGDAHSEHQWGWGYYEFGVTDMKEAVEERCLYLLRDCDVLLGYLDDPTSFGSIAEIAYASAIGKPSVLFIVADNTTREQMYDAYWFASCLPKVTSALFTSFDAAREGVAKFISLANDNKIASVLNALPESPLELAFFAEIVKVAGDHGVGWDDAPYLLQEHEGVFFKLKPQYEITLTKNYRLDFLVEAPGLRLAIEIDGHEFHERTKEQATRDKGRDRALAAAGITVLRFTGSEIYRNPLKAVSEVLSFVTKSGSH